MNTLLTPELFNKLQNIIDLPRNKQEEVLCNTLNGLPEEQFTEMINMRLPAVTPQAVRTFGLAWFDKMDIRPNPPDGYVTIDEVAESIGRSKDPTEQAVLLYIWLHFEEIKRAHQDFEGEDALFDYMLTRKDFEAFV